ncbi:MAG: hypothetical protein CR985_02540 [Flavobacteriales bacterium]|nr:MAG: hypothetical protein CR985_02540 [Flavobacteriales bacterium]
MKITVISLDQWGYDRYIVDELKRRKNIEVNHIDFSKYKYEYPSFFHRIYNFLAKTIAKHNIKKAYIHKKINERLADLPVQDQILMVKADHLLPQKIHQIKKHTHKFIAYFSDSIAKCPKIKKMHHLFDEVYSFEKKDAEKYNFNFITNYIYKVVKTDKKNIKYSVFNVGAYDKRINIIEKIALRLDSIAPNYKIIIVGKKAKKHKPKAKNIVFTDKRMNLKDAFENIKTAEAMLDVNRTVHKGLTFRVFESLGYHKKLISTNEDIKNYDFYNPNNIAIIDPDNVEISDDFFSSPYQEIPEELFEKYTINNWVKTVFKL